MLIWTNIRHSNQYPKATSFRIFMNGNRAHINHISL